MGEERKKRTEWEVARVFLHSASFQDMRRLQESLLVVCFERAALALPKRFHMHTPRAHTHTHTTCIYSLSSLQEQKASLLKCSDQILDSSEHLRMAIKQGLPLLGQAKNGDIKSTKRRKSVLKSAQHLPVCLKVSSEPTNTQNCSYILLLFGR